MQETPDILFFICLTAAYISPIGAKMTIMTDKHIFFSVGSEKYGINIAGVKEIIRFEKITLVRDTQKYLKGVINLRGKIVPIIDLRIKFGLAEKDYDDRTIFIIVEINDKGMEYLLGMAVDEVFDVHDIEEKDIQPPPKIGVGNKSKYLKAMVKFNEDIAMLLDIDKILTTNEIINMEGITDKL